MGTTPRDVRRAGSSVPVLASEDFVQYLAARLRRGETLEAIGDSLGVGHTSVLRWLQGTRRPSRMALRLGALLVSRAGGAWPPVE